MRWDSNQEHIHACIIKAISTVMGKGRRQESAEQPAAGGGCGGDDGLDEKGRNAADLREEERRCPDAVIKAAHRQPPPPPAPSSPQGPAAISEKRRIQERPDLSRAVHETCSGTSAPPQQLKRQQEQRQQEQRQQTLPGAVRVHGIEEEEHTQSETATTLAALRLENEAVEPPTARSPLDRFLAPEGAAIVAVARQVYGDDYEEEGGQQPNGPGQPRHGRGRNLATAVKYHPNAKDSRGSSSWLWCKDSRRLRLYALLAFAAMLAVVIGAAVGTTLCRKDEQAPPATPAPTSYRESLGIRERIESVVGSEAIAAPNSPYAKALDWIMFDDPMQLEPDGSPPNLVQRYIAAYFYFATTTDGPWRGCEDPWRSGGETSSCVPNGTDISTLKSEAAWLSNATECKWVGVRCDERGQITKVLLCKLLSESHCTFRL